MKSSRKVTNIFLVIMTILLISLVGLFFFQKETERQKVQSLTIELDEHKTLVVKKDGEIKGLQQKNFLLEEKNKEADDRLNSLMDELELEEALREEMKGDIVSLKEKLQGAVRVKEEALAQRSQDKESLVQVQEKMAQLTEDLNQSEQERLKLEKALEQYAMVTGLSALEGTAQQIGKGLSPAVDASPLVSAMQTIGQQDNVELEKIVVAPGAILQGRVVSIDVATDFVIVSLGEKEGLTAGRVLSIYRGNEYLGDVQVTRVQESMSAADFLPPLTSKLVQKNDQVIAKE